MIDPIKSIPSIYRVCAQGTAGQIRFDCRLEAALKALEAAFASLFAEEAATERGKAGWKEHR